MKKTILILMLVMIPFLMLAKGFNLPTKVKGLSFLPESNTRGWRLYEQVLSAWGIDEIWTVFEKYEIGYNSSHPGRIETITSYYMNHDLQEWQPELLIERSYIGNTEYISSSQLSFILDEQTLPVMRSLVTYDNQMRLTSMTNEEFDFENSIWVASSKLYIVYVSNQDYTVYNWYSGFEDKTDTWSKINFIWDDQGRVIDEVESSSPDSLNWTAENKTERTYHPADTTTGDIFVMNIAKMLPLSFFFDDQVSYGMVDEEYHYWNMDESRNVWVPEDHILYTYNAQNELEQGLSQSWETGAWVDNFKNMYYYDDNGNLNVSIEYYYDEFMEDWILFHKLDSYWEAYTSQDDNHTPALSGLNLLTYPSPFVSSLSLNVQSKNPEEIGISIYNLKGQLVRTLSAKPNQNLVWDGKTNSRQTAGAGIYFINAQQGKLNSTKKIVKLN